MPGLESAASAAQRLQPGLVDLRRRLHAVPETGLDLPTTQAMLLDALGGLPLEITTGIGCTSITAVLRGRAPVPDGARRPVVLLRADMDALPVEEQTGLDFASTNGAMHACGHDLHMAMLVGAARLLAEQVDDLVADVVLMLQPGEEGYGGAVTMIDEGVLDAAGRRADCAYALHVFSAGDPRGTFGVRTGTMLASSDNLDVVVRGKGGHGAQPHRALDPVPAMCEMVLGTQVLVGRRFDVSDPVLVTVGVVQAGTARNVIPDEARFSATLRAFSAPARDRLGELLPPMLEGIAAAHGASVDVDLARRYPPTINHDEHVERAAGLVAGLFGEDRLIRLETPVAGSEDFSFVLEQVPGAFIALSAAPAGSDENAPFNHSPRAVYDDAVLCDGAALLAALASTAAPVPASAGDAPGTTGTTETKESHA